MKSLFKKAELLRMVLFMLVFTLFCCVAVYALPRQGDTLQASTRALLLWKFYAYVGGGLVLGLLVSPRLGDGKWERVLGCLLLLCSVLPLALYPMQNSMLSLYSFIAMGFWPFQLALGLCVSRKLSLYVEKKSSGEGAEVGEPSGGLPRMAVVLALLLLVMLSRHLWFSATINQYLSSFLATSMLNYVFTNPLCGFILAFLFRPKVGSSPLLFVPPLLYTAYCGFAMLVIYSSDWFASWPMVGSVAYLFHQIAFGFVLGSILFAWYSNKKEN